MFRARSAAAGVIWATRVGTAKRSRIGVPTFSRLYFPRRGKGIVESAKTKEPLFHDIPDQIAKVLTDFYRRRIRVAASASRGERLVSDDVSARIELELVACIGEDPNVSLVHFEIVRPVRVRTVIDAEFEKKEDD